jgi:hypothetical protein
MGSLDQRDRPRKPFCGYTWSMVISLNHLSEARKALPCRRPARGVAQDSIFVLAGGGPSTSDPTATGGSDPVSQHGCSPASSLRASVRRLPPVEQLARPPRLSASRPSPSPGCRAAALHVVPVPFTARFSAPVGRCFWFTDGAGFSKSRRMPSTGLTGMVGAIP